MPFVMDRYIIIHTRSYVEYVLVYAITFFTSHSAFSPFLECAPQEKDGNGVVSPARVWTTVLLYYVCMYKGYILHIHRAQLNTSNHQSTLLLESSIT
jgi:hypothetical protein